MRRGEKDPAASTLEAESRETPEPETGATPKSQLRGILNSIVVRSSENDGGSEFVDGEVGALDDRLGSPSDLRRRGSSSSIRRPVDPLSSHRLGSSPPRHRGSPPPFHRHESPSAFLRRHSPPTPNRRGSPSNFHHRSQRFKENPGDGIHGGFISSPRRQRLDDCRYNPDFDHSVGPYLDRGLRRRSRDISPNHGLGRCRRPSERSLSPFEGEFVYRNDPNLSPREGDWICRNSSCGNVNFAQSTHCNNCNKFRFGSKHNGSSRSTQRQYFDSPPPYEPPSRIPCSRADHSQRDMNGYRSPPHRRGVDDPRGSGTGSPPPVRRGGFPYLTRSGRQEYIYDEYSVRGKSERRMHAEWNRGGDHRLDGPHLDRRGYDQCPPSPRDRRGSESRERSRSPLGERPPKGSYMDRGRDYRRYDDASHEGHVQGGDSGADRCWGFRQGDHFHRGEGRADRLGMGRGWKASVH